MKLCVTDIGTTWQLEFNVLGEIINDIEMNVPPEFNASGRTTKKVWSMQKYATMGIKLLQEGKNADVTVFSVTDGSWEIT